MLDFSLCGFTSKADASGVDLKVRLAQHDTRRLDKLHISNKECYHKESEGGHLLVSSLVVMSIFRKRNYFLIASAIIASACATAAL